jgi:hypothetical protein
VRSPLKSSTGPSTPWHPGAAFALGLTLALALVGAPAVARHPDLDLDRLSDGQIDALLQAELDDDDLLACGLPNVRAAVPDQQMFEIIMCALGDDGDDASESNLDLDDLEAEMAEANTTLEAVVSAAIQRADVLAQGAPLTVNDVRAALGLAEPGVATETREAPVLYAVDDGYVNPGKAAVPQTKAYVRQAIRAKR